MAAKSRYNAQNAEQKWRDYWEEHQTYQFVANDSRPVYSIDTPPPTVSGDLHLGHCYSYTQTDIIARFWRMNGFNVYYPMGWDDNGLPTERLVERRLGIKPERVGREKFIEGIIEISKELEANYENLWRRIGLSVDWRHVYSTISPEARKVSQYSFIDLFNKQLVYRDSAPTIWCPECRTAIAQAEVNDLERESNFVTLAFRLADGDILPIATTRPELLPACVAIFVNPDDDRYRQFIGTSAATPMFSLTVPIMADPKADPTKGTGVVMCCTFGDTTDVEWWYKHKLPLRIVVEKDGTLNELAGPAKGLHVKTARERITKDLGDQGLLLGQQRITQVVRVHERCDTPVEYIVTQQWFVRILDRKEEFLEAGRKIAWHPAYMLTRYENWVQNLGWDWAISRQRYFGVPFPVWYCADCGDIILAELSELPVNPLTQHPSRPCPNCGKSEVIPETDVMDTWATSSVSPLIVTKWLQDDNLFQKLFPMSLRPQAHDIIRTWAFDTIVKSMYHLGLIPWSNIAISGHGLAPEGTKISKSRGGGPIDPTEMMNRYSADAVRYWAASTDLGRDSLINEEKIAVGNRLVIKLWNIARFSLPFLETYVPQDATPVLAPSDRWVMSRLNRLIQKATDRFRDYDYVPAKDELESFFWNTLADNYLEMVKARLYELDKDDQGNIAARYVLFNTLLATIKMFAPFVPFITEDVYQLLYVRKYDEHSIHVTKWPEVSDKFLSETAEQFGIALVSIATEVRRFKAANQLSMGAQLSRIRIACSRSELLADLRESTMDIKSVTRAREVEFSTAPIAEAITAPDGLQVAIES